MNWVLLLALLGWAGVPSFLLMGDRILDIDSHDVLKRGGVAFVIGSTALLAVAAVLDSSYVELVAWGALVGLLGTIALDIVRLIGVRANTFPLDMPVVFGFMAFGRAGKLQANVMGQVIAGVVDAGTVKEFVAARISRIPRLSERQRVNAAAAMMGAVATLDEERKQQVGEAQFAALGNLSDVDRRTVMAAMDAAGVAEAPGQPRGLPRVELHQFRRAAKSAFAILDRTDAQLMGRARAAGYLWHVVNGVSFGIAFALIAGQGNWALAVAWGVFVWLGMMVAMPAMMPVLALPPWFPFVPFIAHIAMIVPYLALAVWVSDAADAASFIGWLTG
ncbi:MAG: hypothetical protein BMS9Abin07_1624 [Acidimicrobiia bacterium]|nr:MAG: hypothetical protein BMS9Abin07_1624 [Acidimicrobiia bacterium]